MRLRHISALLASSLLLLTGACSGSDDKKEATEAEKLPVVKTAVAEERSVPQTVTLTATVEPEALNNISAQMANRIKAIYVDEGMRVSKGQKLVQLDDVNTTSYRLQVDNARADLENVQRDYDRAAELLRIGGGTQQQVDQMHTQLVNARNSLQAAERTPVS